MTESLNEGSWRFASRAAPPGRDGRGRAIFAIVMGAVFTVLGDGQGWWFVFDELLLAPAVLRRGTPGHRLITRPERSDRQSRSTRRSPR